MRRSTIKRPQHTRITGSRGKKSHIGRGNVGFATMPKRKKSTFKKYRGQGKWKTN